MEAELGTFQVTIFSWSEPELCHFRAPSNTLFCMRKRNCGTLSLSIFLVRRRNFKPKNIPCVEAELQNCRTSIHIIVCVRKRNFRSHNSMWNLSGFLSKNPKYPGTQGRRPLCQSHLGCAVLNCAILTVAPTGIVLVCGRKRNFKSHNSLYLESLCFLCKNPKCPGAHGRRPLCQSHLGDAVLNCAILAVAPTGIVLVCSVLIKHDRIS